MNYAKYPSKKDIARYTPTRGERNTIARGLFREHSHKLYVKKESRDTYSVFCSSCQTYKTITRKEYSQTRRAHVCPMCLTPIKSTTRKEEEIYYDYVNIENYGYSVTVKFKFGKLPVVSHIKQLMYFLDETATLN